MLMQPEVSSPPAETWETLQFLGLATLVLGLVVLIVGGALRINSGRRRPIAGLFVVACGAISIVGGTMSIGKVDPPDNYLSRLSQPCYRTRTNETTGVAELVLSGDELTECVEAHYSQTGVGIGGIVFGSALALMGVWLFLPDPRQVSHPTPSPSPSTW